MKERIVKTYTGKSASRKDCKKIKGEFYLVGEATVKDSGECYLVENKYHRYNNGKIEFDHEKNTYVLIHKNHLKHGVIDFIDDSMVYGYFTSNLTKNILAYNDRDGNFHCISEEIAKKMKYRERFATGVFHDRTEYNSNYFTKITKPPVRKNDLPYDSRFASNITEVQFQEFYDPKFDNNNLNILGDFLDKNGITFGIEFETSAGYIPDRLCYKYGLLALRDGSIDGLEYVTIPLSGRKGLYALRSICNELVKRCKFNSKCALHIHIGGLKREMDSMLSAYVLGILVQDDMFKLQPAYKKGGAGVKNKDYCKALSKDLFNSMKIANDKSNLLSEFSKLFNFVSDGNSFSSYDNNLDNVNNHPSDPSGTAKWHIRSRYNWLNFVPIMFGNKKTLEFRHHSTTFNFESIINFLFNCASFIKVAETFKDDILNNNSDFYKDLTSTSKNSNDVMKDYLISNGHSQLSNINVRNKEYNAIRETIMGKMTSAGDIMGDTESKFNGLYAKKLSGKFWD